MILEEYQSIFKVVFNDDSLRNLQVVKVRFCKIEPMLTRARLASSGDRLARESVDEITDKKSIKVKVVTFLGDQKRNRQWIGCLWWEPENRMVKSITPKILNLPALPPCLSPDASSGYVSSRSRSCTVSTHTDSYTEDL